MGEIKIIAIGKEIQKDLPVSGIVTFVYPNGSVIELDILDILEVEWYKDIA